MTRGLFSFPASSDTLFLNGQRHSIGIVSSKVQRRPEFITEFVKDRLSHIGNDFDFLIGAYNNDFPDRYQFLQVGTYRFCLAVPRVNPLSKRKSLSWKDLTGQPLMIMKKGTSPINDRIRGDIEKNFPEINIPYSISASSGPSPYKGCLIPFIILPISSSKQMLRSSISPGQKASP